MFDSEIFFLLSKSSCKHFSFRGVSSAYEYVIATTAYKRFVLETTVLKAISNEIVNKNQ